MKFVIFTLLVIAAMVMAAPQKRDVCSPMGQYCRQYEDCCRHLICMGAASKCVMKGGLIVPGQDTRPLGPGPYPPNVPLQ